MPASKADRIKMLLDRHVFAEQVLLSGVLEAHQIRQCCKAGPCLGADALIQSIHKLSNDTYEEVNRERRARRSKKRRPD